MKKSIYKRLMALGMTICLLTGAAGCGKTDEGSSEEPVSEEVQENAVETEAETAETNAEPENAEDSEYDDFEIQSLGMTMAMPYEYSFADGVVSIDCNDLSGSEGVFYALVQYVGMTAEEIEAMTTGVTMSQEDSIRYLNSRVPMFSIVATAKKRSIEEIVEFLRNGGIPDAEESDLTLIKTVDDSSFYDFSRIDTTNYDNLDKVFQDEYDNLVTFKDEIYARSTYSKPFVASEDVAGTGVSFTTTDFDGNTVTSEEIFSKYDVTMVNVWATWCRPCVNELEELENISKSLEKKNCAIVGLCGDAVDPETLAKAKELLESKGVTYLNLVPFDGWQQIFTMNGWPSSFFIGKDGTNLDAPITGAAIARYESYVDDILAGKSSTVTGGESASAENAYVIQVVDQSGNPIENAMVQYCTNDMCQLKPTDKDGTITFSDPPGVYEIHILQVPDGYEENKEVYTTEDHYSSMTITVNKK